MHLAACTHFSCQLLPHWLLHLYHKHLHNPFSLTRIKYKESDLGGKELTFFTLDNPDTIILLQAGYALTTKFLSTCNGEWTPKAKNTICVQRLSVSLCLAVFWLFSHILNGQNSIFILKRNSDMALEQATLSCFVIDLFVSTSQT